MELQGEVEVETWVSMVSLPAMTEVLIWGAVVGPLLCWF